MSVLIILLIIAVLIFMLPYVLLIITYMASKNTSLFENIKKVDAKPSISIVIATYNEEKNIDNKIQNILSLDYPKEMMEIIVIDSSTDGTPEKVLAWIEKYPQITLKREKERRGLATALNLGYSSATGDIVIKSDCDITHPVNALQEITTPFVDPSIGAVSGKQILVNSPSAAIRTEQGYRSIKDYICEIQSKFDSTHIFEPFSAYRKDLIEPIRTNSVADDGELALNIRMKGFRTIFLREAHFYETAPLTMAENIRQKSRRGQGHVQLLIQNRKLLFNRKYGNFGLIIFPTIFLLMIINPWLLGVLGLGITYVISAMFSINYIILLLAASASIFFIYVLGYPKILNGFIETQLSLIIGSISLILLGPSFMWEKNE